MTTSHDVTAASLSRRLVY